MHSEIVTRDNISTNTHDLCMYTHNTQMTRTITFLYTVRTHSD